MRNTRWRRYVPIWAWEIYHWFVWNRMKKTIKRIKDAKCVNSATQEKI